jgi:2,3-bisphosphoglycerate-independent phosphoglycerate mutase
MGEKTNIMVFICDGLCDWPIAELGGRTPLEAAETPRMDMLALRGETCIVDIIAPGVRPGSDTAHLALCGGDGLGHEVSDVDPHEVGVPIWTAEGIGQANEKTARIINDFVKRSYEILKEHPVNAKRIENGEPPANVLLPRGIGVAPHIPPFGERYGLKGAAAVEVGLIRGIARYLELDVIELPPSVTGGLDSDFDALYAAALAAFDEYEFLLINAKGPDVAGHDNDPVAKVEAIERIDAALEPVVERVAKGVHLALLADHSTPCAVGDHSGDPVPCLFYGPGVRADDTATFGERNCARGGAGRLRGRDVLPILMQLSGRAKKFGA